MKNDLELMEEQKSTLVNQGLLINYFQFTAICCLTTRCRRRARRLASVRIPRPASDLERWKDYDSFKCASKWDAIVKRF